ncbi:hypothetical protein HYPSUDRAFT_220598 [Hypholoma sublateritium FD-334 SS-4]|uniref:F-box domain-containing protein n=1 Tax=Hypholoma sublateritium (strain FD-334 SS-4) TaxID=945553 RepID=A0A0D2N4Y7_HYPSF|nr:hypothetical protein HYPSUDRAFT_220598 [Hypholoma sublateritium FD-334 SS-4]
MSILDLPATTDDILLDYLHPSEFLKYSRVCKHTHAVVKSYMKRAFDIDKLLARFFSPAEILRFRELQCSTGMIISGSIALQFFERVVYPDSDLNLYIEYRFSRQVADWLVKSGYNYAPRPEPDTPQSLEDAFLCNPHSREDFPERTSFLKNSFSRTEDYVLPLTIFNFEKRHPHRKIQLVTSLMSPLQRVLGFHSTCVMNIITHDKAYSFYPLATFGARCSLLCREGVKYATSSKYEERGWPMYTPYDICATTARLYSLFSLGRRYVGDSCCWTIPIASAPDLTPGYIESNSWVIRLKSFHWSNAKITAQYNLLATKRLKFSYTVGFGDWHMEAAVEKCIGQNLEPAENSQESREYLDEEVLRYVEKLREESEYDRLDTDSEPEPDNSDSDFLDSEPGSLID